MTLAARVTQKPDRSVVALSGELDLASVSDLAEAVGVAMGGGRRNLVVDVAQLRFCDSEGLEALLRIQADVASGGGTMTLTHVHGRVQRVMELTGLGQAFTIIPEQRKGS
ncbi:anti-sigma B factor antagonist/stage II sporulation protein AA (anti-sigma F factor antagonist) [Nonomuraea jiangxiensis]|uniref:Anti-sigma factor antagonist n=2 Tax=Nonomuraea jiangxiensis TaxID=633440 RepID=A0A1G9JF50_9ACTN|nr:STAS domain-containing protein [Nonomuraea jiangxiensis]SDL36001.1 anti-sigma B factor antagonist/stage II sporulation protein AA (anti-sigma F factor antagonist) [Nonomuraea jiangxiensis]